MYLSEVASVLARLPVAVASVFVLCGIQGALAQDYSPAALSVLPPYCMYTQGYREMVPGGNDPARIKQYSSIVGPEFNHLHHFCRGLTLLNIAKFQKMTPVQRKQRYGVAIREITYVMDRSRPNHPLMPEFLTRRGEAYIAADSMAAGLGDLQRAAKLNPEYWPSHIALADAYIRLNQPATAREWLAEGLAHSPDSKTLKQKWAELDAAQGGKRTPLPAPVVRPAPTAQPSAGEPPSPPAMESPAPAGSSGASGSPP